MLAQKHGDQFRPLEYYSQQLDCGKGTPPLQESDRSYRYVNGSYIEELVVAFPLTVKVSWESPQTQHLSE